jgi:aspartate ammonia-lyase
MSVTPMTSAVRIEHDSLGEILVPASACWGAQTARAIVNFPISGIPISHHTQLIRALAMVKQAAALANHHLGALSRERCEAIVAAAQEIMDGKWHDHFPVDVFQGGAGTSTNMNINEEISHRGLELMGHTRVDRHALHPNDHVNLSQSTNGTYPTSVRLSVLLSIAPLCEALDKLARAFEAKAEVTSLIVKLGRTRLQDAVPMTVGQELGAYAATIREDIQRLDEASRLLCEVNLGGTALGTRIDADPRYGNRAIASSRGFPDFPRCSQRISWRRAGTWADSSCSPAC